MIYPTRMAVLAAAIGVPVTLLVAMLFPATWYAGLGWPLAVLTLVFADAVLGHGPLLLRSVIAGPRGADKCPFTGRGMCR